MKRLILLSLLLAACTGAPAGTTAAGPAGPSPATPAARVTAIPTATPVTAGAPTSTAVIAIGPSCRAPATPTTASTEGPYFKAGSPQKDSLVTADMAGTRLTLFAFVLARSCAPVAGAKVDIWQADANGSYDNTGYTLRGHVFTDAQGRFQMQTIVPGRYPGRTPHIHVKVEPPGGPMLTTQLYMPNEASNASDGIFRPELTVSLSAPNLAVFMFIVDKP